MSFKEEIKLLENLTFEEEFIIKKGNIPILFSAPHTINQKLNDSIIKLGEPFTKAISLYLNEKYNTYSFIKTKDTGNDPNRDNHDTYIVELKRLIKKEKIKLIIDLHGASKNRDFDIEFGTLNNLSADFSTIRELEEAFIENGITKIKHNEPFKGGAITQSLFSLKDIEIVQLEINGNYRNYNNIELLQKIINALSDFIKQYIEYISR